MKIKKAVIPAAGFGTRILPATKAMPKEMYPIFDKPAIQYVVEEAVDSGITDILIITNRGKSIIEDHFDVNPELERTLEKNHKYAALESIKKISELANIHFIRQGIPKGLGHAVYRAKSFIGNEPFAVLYPDDVIYSDYKPVCKQLIEAHEEFRLGVVGAKEVPKDEISKYGSLKVKNIRDNLFMCSDMVEKPKAHEVMSYYSIFGRCILPPEIFEILKNTPPGIGGEIQLTDAMKILAKEKGFVAVDFIGKRYDIGNKLGILEAITETALRNNEVSLEFKEYINKLFEGNIKL